MIWHIVRFDMSEVDEPTRSEIEGELAALDAIDAVGFLRVGRDIAEPGITGLVTAFANDDDLEAYRVHPDHQPVVTRIRELGIPVVRLDVESDDRVQDLP